MGILNTIPSFVSKRTSPKEQDERLGIVNSVGGIAQIFGPLIGGFIFDFAGFFAFLTSTGLLIVVFGLSCQTFQTCQLQKEK